MLTKGESVAFDTFNEYDMAKLSLLAFLQHNSIGPQIENLDLDGDLLSLSGEDVVSNIRGS